MKHVPDNSHMPHDTPISQLHPVSEEAQRVQLCMQLLSSVTNDELQDLVDKAPPEFIRKGCLQILDLIKFAARKETKNTP